MWQDNDFQSKDAIYSTTARNMTFTLGKQLKLFLNVFQNKNATMRKDQVPVNWGNILMKNIIL